MSLPRVTRFSSQEARRLDLWSDLAGVKPAGSSLLASSSRLSSPRERSGWPVRASSCVLLLPVVKRPPRSSDRQDGHGRGLPTEAERRPVAPHPVQDDASLRATATRARAMPLALAIFMPQARRADHLRLSTRS